MKRVFQLLREEWPRYVIEILVIIVGISLSFLLNEWRIAREEKATEQRLIRGLHDNLVADSTALSGDLKIYTTGMSVFQTFLEGNPRWESYTKDSLITLITSFVNYSIFIPNDITYEEIKQSGNSRIITNKKLLSDVIHLYSTNYLQISETNKIGSSYVLERILPYLDTHLPAHISDTVGKDRDEIIAVLKAIRNAPAFMNLLKTHYQLKLSVQISYRNTLTELRRLIAAVNTESQRF